jgi:hypothetical protein
VCPISPIRTKRGSGVPSGITQLEPRGSGLGSCITVPCRRGVLGGAHAGTGDAPDRRQGMQSAQVPKISRSWLTSWKPCSAAIAATQVSTAGAWASTAFPQLRQTR